MRRTTELSIFWPGLTITRASRAPILTEMLEDGSNEDFTEGLGFDPICAAAAVAVVMMLILVASIQWPT